MVVLNQSLQIIDKEMGENIVVRNRGGGCIVKTAPLFSPNGKYVYILCGSLVSAYSVQTGECTHQFATESKEDLVSAAVFNDYLLTVTSSGNLAVWNTTENVLEKSLALKLIPSKEKTKNKSGRGNGFTGENKGNKGNNIEEVAAVKEEDEDFTEKINGNGENQFLMKKQSKNYDSPVVVQLYAVSNQQKNNSSFDVVIVVKEKCNNFVALKSKRQSNSDPVLRVLRYNGEDGRFRNNLYINADDKPHSVSVCDEFVAAIKQDRISVVPFYKEDNKASGLAGGERWWTVVAVAPEGRGLAAGDNSGRIVFWSHPYQLTTRAMFHWHTLPVNTITFSATGSYMYSGGGEGVMVRWNVEVSNVRNFLPRLPAPILHLTVSPDNQYVAIATQDNGIQLADAQNRVSCVIQKLTWGVTPVAGFPLFPAGMSWDPRSRSIILNGRPGYLQFFNADDNKLLFNLDITGQNYVSKERHKEVVHAEVTHVAMSHDGKWMVTVETRDDRESFLETLLKFWQYKFNARQFSLNTCIQIPHQGRVNRIKFQPPSSVTCSATLNHYLLVTTGTDCKFRMWTPSTTDSIHSEGLHWVCESVGDYRAQPADCAAFSADGSILGVSFGASLTLWDAEICQLNTSLTRDNDALKAVEFGYDECCHLVVAASDYNLNVWSILTLYVVWTVPVRTSVLCADPLSSNMAVFTDDNSVFVFTPSSPKLVYERKELCRGDAKVLAAIFVPRPHKLLDSNTAWSSDSQLHFIDSNQELQYLEAESELDPEQNVVRSARSVMPHTPFSLLAAHQSTSDVAKTQSTLHEQFGTAADVAVRKLLRNPAHTMPHIHLFCANFLKSLAITRKTENEQTEEDPEEEIKMQVDEDSDSDAPKKPQETIVLAKKKKKKRPRKGKAKLAENMLISSPEKLISSPEKNQKEMSTKKKNKKKLNKEKLNSSPRRKENSFTFDDLDKDWLSVLENR